MMDDGPRIGGLQWLLAMIALTTGYLTFGAQVWGAAPFFVASAGGLVWLERYARRRVREDREERERRLREMREGVYRGTSGGRERAGPFDAG
jgi:membrane protein implicated in regulation of membrane protease activity